MYQGYEGERYAYGLMTRGSFVKSLGAPAIAIVAGLALAVELDHKKDGNSKKLYRQPNSQLMLSRSQFNSGPRQVYQQKTGLPYA